jgi:hypothetical protein
LCCAGCLTGHVHWDLQGLRRRQPQVHPGWLQALPQLPRNQPPPTRRLTSQFAQLTTSSPEGRQAASPSSPAPPPLVPAPHPPTVHLMPPPLPPLGFLPLPLPVAPRAHSPRAHRERSYYTSGLHGPHSPFPLRLQLQHQPLAQASPVVLHLPCPQRWASGCGSHALPAPISPRWSWWSPMCGTRPSACTWLECSSQMVAPWTWALVTGRPPTLSLSPLSARLCGGGSLRPSWRPRGSSPAVVPSRIGSCVASPSPLELRPQQPALAAPLNPAGRLPPLQLSPRLQLL